MYREAARAAAGAGGGVRRRWPRRGVASGAARPLRARVSQTPGPPATGSGGQAQILAPPVHSRDQKSARVRKLGEGEPPKPMEVDMELPEKRLFCGS